MTTMGRQGVVWKTPNVTADGLKLFACVTMLIQNVGIIIVEKGMIGLDQYTQASLNEALAADSHLMMLAGVGSVMQLVGGMAVPVFAFLLTEGFRNTSNYRKYLLSVVLFALISEIPYDFAMSGKVLDLSGQNAMLGMAIALMMLYYLKMAGNLKKGSRWILWIVTLAVALFWSGFLRVQYGLAMLLLVWIFYVFYEKNVLKTVLGIFVSLLYVTGPVSFYGIWCYTGERKDRLPKYAYYVFYPLQLLVLGVAAMFV
jgi:hypothetical protein